MIYKAPKSQKESGRIIYVYKCLLKLCFRPCSDGASNCTSSSGSYRCICKYGRHGEFCEDIDENPPFTGMTSTAVTMTTVATTIIAGAHAQSSAAVIDGGATLYTTINSTSKSSAICSFYYLLTERTKVYNIKKPSCC